MSLIAHCFTEAPTADEMRMARIKDAHAQRFMPTDETFAMLNDEPDDVNPKLDSGDEAGDDETCHPASKMGTHIVRNRISQKSWWGVHRPTPTAPELETEKDDAFMTQLLDESREAPEPWFKSSLLFTLACKQDASFQMKWGNSACMSRR
mmetsp:Transcript_27200/g.64217  ORF Transcript_27200/g.64217 Transcript_27200/m.64217 type:complete len:150 (-) Transcript_27200:99-548(-)